MYAQHAGDDLASLSESLDDGKQGTEIFGICAAKPFEDYHLTSHDPDLRSTPPV